MKNVKIDLAAALALKKVVEDEIINLSEKQFALIDNINELKEILEKLEFVKLIGLDVRVKEYEEELKRFDGFIDNKYWNEEALFCIGLLISSNSARTIKEAIAQYEDYKKLQQ